MCIAEVTFYTKGAIAVIYFFSLMDNGLLSPPKGAYVCLCACVGVQVTSCAELPVNVPQTPLEAQESPVL